MLGRMESGRIRHGAWLVVAASVGGLLTWLTMKSISWGHVLNAMEGIPWHALALAFTAVLGGTLLGAYRWKLLLPRETVSTGRLFLVKNAGQSLNNISPVRIVADVAQAAMLMRGDGIRAPKVVSSLIMARFFDTLITVNMVGAGLLFLPQLAHLRAVVAPLWGLTATVMLAFLLFGHRMHRLPLIGRLKFLREVLSSMAAVRTRFRVMLSCIGLTSLSWALVGTAAWLISREAGVPLPIWVISVVVVGIGFFAAAMPGPPGMMGVYEFVAVSTLSLFAVDPSIALSFALVVHGVFFLPPLMIGLPALFVERRRRPNSLPAPPAKRNALEPAPATAAVMESIGARG